MSDIADRVKKVTAETLKVDLSRVRDTSRFVEDLGASSMESVELVAAYEEEFDIDMDEKSALGGQDRRRRREVRHEDRRRLTRQSDGFRPLTTTLSVAESCPSGLFDSFRCVSAALNLFCTSTRSAGCRLESFLSSAVWRRKRA